MTKMQLYFSLYSNARRIEAELHLGELELLSRAILDYVGAGDAANRKVKVTDVVASKSFGTAPTVYDHLARLEDSGWIYYAADPKDARCKLVKLTKRAKSAYGRLAAAMLVTAEIYLADCRAEAHSH